jgi:type II pantothenate kinase
MTNHPTPLAAIDFGISNIDVVARVDGRLLRWQEPSSPILTADAVQGLLARAGVELANLPYLAVTGGRHRDLPPVVHGRRLVSVGELAAIGRGGQAVAGRSAAALDEPLLVVSAGSGTAMVAARGHQYTHATGSGVGGGTMLGLARLLLRTVDPQEIDHLALAGNANGVDLCLSDVISGPIGNLPADATAVNFGRLARADAPHSRADLAAALVTMVSQVIGTLAINAARAHDLQQAVVIGHMTDMRSVRDALVRVGEFFGLALSLPQDVGHATALGALLYAQETQ